MPPENFRPTESSQRVITGKEAKDSGVAREVPDDSHAFICDCGFSSSNWPTKTAAQQRATQHKREHETGELMDEVNEFLAARTKGNK